MKKVFTLTKSLTLAALLLIVAGASASTLKSEGDKDSAKCKRKCCNKKGSIKEMDAAIADFNEAMKDFTAQIKTLDPSFKMQLAQAAAQLSVKKVITSANTYIVVRVADRSIESQQEDKQKINFSNLDKEMSQVQEDMSQMDPSLKQTEEKSRKAADEILKTGIKS